VFKKNLKFICQTSIVIKFDKLLHSTRSAYIKYKQQVEEEQMFTYTVQYYTVSKKRVSEEWR
jgi:hypothetical protein